MIVTFENPSPNENWSPRGLAAVIGKRQSSGDNAKCLLAPTPIESEPDGTSGQSCRATRTPKKPKNHLRAHRQALKEKQQDNRCRSLARQAQEKLSWQQREAEKERLFGKIPSRVFQPTASSAAASSSATVCAADARSAPSSSAGSASGDAAVRVAFGRKVYASTAPGRPTTGVSSATFSGAGSVASVPARHKSFGKTPAYITDRKARIEREEEERRRAREQAPPAPGLMLLADAERQKTLRMLEEREREAREELQNIPFRMEE